MHHRRDTARGGARRTLLAAAAVVALTGALAACGSDDDSGSPGTTGTSPSTSGTSSTAPDVETTTATLFFVRSEKVAAAGEDVEVPAVARGALEALFAGPDDLESGIGMTSEIPEGTELLDVTIDGGEAVVDVSSQFESGGGSLSMQLRVAQVVYTLTAFDTVDTVSFEIEGSAVDAIGGEGVPASGLTRDDFRDVTPFVLVTSPLPGEEVSSPLEIMGTANTFEANVLYEVVDADGAVLTRGFTTATAGNGTWGTFSVGASFTVASPGDGTVVAYQDDMESGGRRDVYEVPVQLG